MSVRAKLICQGCGRAVASIVSPLDGMSKGERFVLKNALSAFGSGNDVTGLLNAGNLSEKFDVQCPECSAVTEGANDAR